MISRRLGKRVDPGDLVVVGVDIVYAHDGTAPLVIDVVEGELGMAGRRPAAEAYFFIDHASPPPHLAAASVHKRMRAFARAAGVRVFDVGSGISHQVLVDEGIVGPGAVAVGADSHTPTLGALGAVALGLGSTDVAVALMFGKTWLKVPESVLVKLTGALGKGVMGKDVALHILGRREVSKLQGRVVEYGGSGLSAISVDSRLTLANMSTEMMAASSIMPVDRVLEAFLGTTGARKRLSLDGYSPSEGEFADLVEVELGAVEPMVAKPPDVFNVAPVSEVEGVEVDQVFIGSCTNGRLEDLEVAARILAKRRVKEGVRCIVSPASKKVYEVALERGILGALLRSGCLVAHPTCGPCVGAHMGLLAEGEVAVATTNRNFPGRMGHRDSKVYLASPATAAAAAAEGRLADPRRFL